jgi:4-hydroxybenzoate polyprenyltransferase
MTIRKKISAYARLMRFDKPVGILLLLWPTVWALWLASAGKPDTRVLAIFVAGVIIMRAAGCIINDFADRYVDGHVLRTSRRPLVSGEVSVKEALILFVLLMTLAFGLVLLCNWLTVLLAFVGALLATTYPFLKRITHLPQLGLGLAFSWGVPMAFAAQTNQVPASAWWLFATAMIWPVIYDTFYAMADKQDDIKIGVKSTAILFANYDRVITSVLQLIFIVMLAMTGYVFQLGTVYDVSLVFAAILFLYQQQLIEQREPAACFAAFLNNSWVGAIIFAGILMSYLL